MSVVIRGLAVCVVAAVCAAAAGTEKEQRAEVGKLVDSIRHRLTEVGKAAKARKGADLEDILDLLRGVDMQLERGSSSSAAAPARKRPDSMESLSMQEKTRANLGSVRLQLMKYYGDTEGKFPVSPKDLVPRYLPAFPFLELPDHPPTDKVRIIPKIEGEEAKHQVEDTGKWLYVGDPKREWGEFLIDCTHKDADGDPWFTR